MLRIGECRLGLLKSGADLDGRSHADGRFAVVGGLLGIGMILK